MKIHRDTLLLYAVTDSRWATEETPFLSQLEAALRGGVTLVQLREKSLGDADFLAEAIAAKALCARYHVPLLINDNVEIALQSGADGVHLGQGDTAPETARRLLGEDKIIGVTAKTIAQAHRAEAAGADYLGSGAVFATGTKSDAVPLDHAVFREICSAVQIPVCAIGGITRENLPQLTGLGAAGFALVSAIFAAGDIEAECKALREIAAASR